MVRASSAVLVVLVASLFGWPCAADNERLDEAERLVGEAEFESALGALDAASEADSLTREDVVRLFFLRALVHHALGNERQCGAALSQLAALSPEHQFGAAVPPDLRTRFEEAREALESPLALEVEAREIRGGFQIEAQIAGDQGEELVEQTVIVARLPGGEWVRTEGRRASIPIRGDGAVEYYVLALGPGDAVLLQEGSEDQPRLIGDPNAEQERPPVEQAIQAAAQQGGGDDDDDDPRVSPWVWVGVSVGVLAVAGGVVAAIFLTRDAQNTQLGAPEVDWP